MSPLPTVTYSMRCIMFKAHVHTFIRTSRNDNSILHAQQGDVTCPLHCVGSKVQWRRREHRVVVFIFRLIMQQSIGFLADDSR